MEDKISLLVLFGGVSSEHEVSCSSAASVLNHINRDKYNISTIGITKEGNWLLTCSPVVNIGDGSWENDKSNRRAFVSPDHSIGGVLVDKGDGTFETVHIDVVFPVLHGKNGEDGSMQGLLQIANLPFVGPDVAASASSMDKAVTKAMIQQSGVVEQAKCYVSHRGGYENALNDELSKISRFFDGKLPLFVKPANAGSSVGISKVKDMGDMPKALETAFNEDDKVLVEEAIAGREIEVAVLGNEDPKASLIGEIFSAHEFYDYNSKYENAESRTAIVRDLTPEKETEIREKAVKVYSAMGCEGLSRVDFFLEESGRVVFNEINTLPGFTSISMYPKLWEETGIPYDQLIDKLIELALKRR